MIITIDGLGVNGKSTLAKRISNEIHFKNFSAGAIYRCIALEIINQELEVQDLNHTLKNLKNLDIDFDDEKIFLNGEDVSKQIRTEEVSVKSTNWARIPEIKELVRKIQRDFIAKNNTVMEGRDIGTRIAPNADIKFYLYSDFETRVKRLQKDMNTDINEVRENLRKRDDWDINGGNFIKPIDAIEIDTTDKTLDEVYAIMLEEIKKIIR